MWEKKTAVMTIRMTAGTKAAIEREAARREWTPSKMAEKILSAWAEQNEKSDSGGTGGNDIHVEFHRNEIGNVNIS